MIPRMSKFLVTGGAGFIGSNLADALLAGGHRVTVYDDLSTGSLRNLKEARKAPGFRFVRGGLADRGRLRAAAAGCEAVFHLAANADVRFGLKTPSKDLDVNTVGTFSVLEAMRAARVKNILFSSTGSVYGEPAVFPTPETAPFPRQTSLYGASKLAGEGLVSAYCEGFGFRAWVFRFVSILGERYSHGHVYDFCLQLRRDPSVLRVLGDGTQRKSYLYIGDCVAAVLRAYARAQDRFNVLNLGTDEVVSVRQSVARITRRLGLSPRVVYSGGKRGWVGDSPFILLDCAKMRRLGWAPKLSIAQALDATVDDLKGRL